MQRSRVHNHYYSAVVLCLCMGLQAQTERGATDGFTPPTMAPGAPAGSYALSGFENVSLFNGGLAFGLPLVQIGGRGEVGHTVQLNLQRRWQVRAQYNGAGDQILGYFVTTALGRDGWGFGYYQANNLVRYTPGGIIARKVGVGPASCSGQVDPSLNSSSLTRLTFIAADGTETELVDKTTAGAPKNIDCNNLDQNRDTIFLSRDGSGMTFVADSIIHEYFDRTPWSDVPSGYLYFKNGVRYRINAGKIASMIDRNGNTINFTYDGFGYLSKITDALGRDTLFSYFSDRDEITFPGAAGVSRKIIVRFSLLSSALFGDTLSSYSQLFPGYETRTDTFNPDLASSVTLPDGRSYQLFYNRYAEIARVVLPTAGEYRYQYEGGGPSGSSIFHPGGDFPIVYRRVSRRDVHKDGVALEGHTTYGASYGTNGSYGATFVTEARFSASGQNLGQTIHRFNGNALVPPQAQTDPIPFADWRDSREYQKEEYGPGGSPLLRTFQYTWEQRPCQPGEVCNGGWYLTTANDPRLAGETAILNDVSPNLVMGKKYTYDIYNNVTEEKEFDYGSGALPGSPKRRTEILYEMGPYYTSYSTTVPPSAPHLRSLVTQRTVFNESGTQVAQEQFRHDEFSIAWNPNMTSFTPPVTTARGNVTTVRKWLNSPTSTWLETRNEYDDAGNVIKAIDARNNQTLYSFATSCNSGPSNTYAFPTAITNAAGHQTQVQWDCNIGKPKQITDPNSKVTTYSYNDLLDRLTNVAPPIGSTSFNYYDSQRRIDTIQTQASCSGSESITTTAIYDGLGRTISTRKYDVDGQINVDTEFDSLGRVWKTWNPYRNGTTPSAPNQTTYDALSRVVQVTTAAGASTVTDYSGNVVTVTDPAGKKRQTVSDGLGRITSVTEDPNSLAYQTSYLYDALDNLKQVTQGSQTRSFNYDSLGRLVSASNPESGAVSYEYDSNGNLMKRTDALNQVTTYSVYDALNRPTGKSYNDGTPAVSYGYDTVFKGKPTSVSNSASTTEFLTYDNMGRVTQSRQNTGAQQYAFVYSYNQAGGLEQITYPSGRSVRTCFDTAGQPLSLIGTLGVQSTNYVTDMHYWPHGEPQQYLFSGGVLKASTTFNTDLQALKRTFQKVAGSALLLDLELGYATPSQNNGNPWTQSINNGSRTYNQSYTYDALNRLKTVTEAAVAGGASWYQTASYDRYGNRALVVGSWTPTSALTPVVSADVESNVTGQFPSNRWTGAGYDAVGNVTTFPSRSYQYNAENLVTQATTVNVPATHTYDGDGRRVTKTSGGTTTVFVYDAFGQLAAEYGGTVTPGTQYLLTDALGSTRANIDAAGTVTKRFDYLPFGEEIQTGTNLRGSEYGNGSSGRQLMFTSKERDAESSLDYFGARYFSGAHGRFTSPDKLSVTRDRLLASSTLNKYAYATNNPLRFKDPDGRDVVALLEPPHGVRPGHFALFAHNPSTNKAAFMSFGPTDRSFVGQLLTASGGPVGSTVSFEMPKSADDLRRNYTALSIQTSPEQAQEVINFINGFGAGENPYQLFQTNCSTVCRDALKVLGVLPQDFGSITPFGLWSALYERFSNPANQRFSTTTRYGEQFQSLRIDTQKGIDYGSSQFGMNTFDFIMLMLRQQKACVEVFDNATGQRGKQCE